MEGGGRMRAVVVTGPGQLELAERPAPRPEGRALLRVQRAGLCGTDVKILDGDVPVAYPRVIGHELVGAVLEAGATGRFSPGHRVLVDPTVSCGQCWLCRHDKAHLCTNGGLMGRDLDGGFADYLAVDERQLLRIPDDLDDADAALLQILGTCVHGQRLVEAFPGQSAVVVGLGVSGLMHLQLLRLRGIERVVGISRSPHKLELGRRLGATAVATPEDAAAVVADVLGEDGPDLVVESAGKVAALAQAVELAPLGGTVLAFGTISSTQGELPFYQLYYKELAIISSRGARLRDYERGIELAAAGRLQLAPLVSATFPLAQATEAFLTLRQSPEALKVVLDVTA
jgi:2-desacetyl-2-hydroxyethyl bacteriochlorophyllide A dehydrogenase